MTTNPDPKDMLHENEIRYRGKETPENVNGDKNSKEMSSKILRQQLKKIQQKTLTSVENELETMVDAIIQEAESLNRNNSYNTFENFAKHDKKSNNGVLLGKEFVARNSILTDLMKVQHIETIYNIFVVIVLIYFMQAIIFDLLDTGSLRLGVRLVAIAFEKIHYVSCIWIFMTIYSLFLYSGYSIWENSRKEIKPKSTKLYVWDRAWLIAFFIYDIFLICIPTKMLLYVDLPFASSFIVLMEQVRYLMKTYAFVRTNAGRCLDSNPKKDKSKKVGPPSFNQYLYFLFIPTIVYRDNYPRSKEIRWNKVIWYFIEVLVGIFFMSFVWERTFVAKFDRFGLDPISPKNLLLIIFGTMVPSMLVYTTGFYILLHSWMNAWAEMLTYADRMFYQDWWNSASYSRFYRTWNIVVHDWLFTYIYMDMYEKVTKQNRALSMLAVFYISALFHEYILAFVLRMFVPILLVLFGVFGTGFTFLVTSKKRSLGNVFMWFTLITGNGVLFSLYTMEFYARHNCPRTDDTMWDYFIPRAWNCNAIL